MNRRRKDEPKQSGDESTIRRKTPLDYLADVVAREKAHQEALFFGDLGPPEPHPKKPPVLTAHEKKIWAVACQGAKGMQYCRELDRAGIRPRKTGAWRGCPGSYAGAYLDGQPWRKLIQDEKYKVSSKGKSLTTR